MSQGKYVAYVSTYTVGREETYGIKIYDVDMKNGRMTEKNQVKITNSSYITISHNGKYLYSITDFGVEAYKILPGGVCRQVMAEFCSLDDFQIALLGLLKRLREVVLSAHAAHLHAPHPHIHTGPRGRIRRQVHVKDRRDAASEIL